MARDIDLRIELSQIADQTVTVTLRGGQQRTGKLVKITVMFVCIMTDKGMSFVVPEQIVIIDVP